MAETAVRLTPEILPYAEHLELLSLDSDSRDGKTVEAIEALWRYEPLRELVLAKNHTFQLNDSAPYFCALGRAAFVRSDLLTFACSRPRSPLRRSFAASYRR